MLIWKSNSVARRRQADVDVGDLPVTTPILDLEKYPQPYQTMPDDKFAPTSDDSSRRSHRWQEATTTLLRVDPAEAWRTSTPSELSTMKTLI